MGSAITVSRLTPDWPEAIICPTPLPEVQLQFYFFNFHIFSQTDCNTCNGDICATRRVANHPITTVTLIIPRPRQPSCQLDVPDIALPKEIAA
ncbi:MAG: hypothetical protein Q8K74_08735 [Candidatus Nitrotoga sp.]|nr:hypothetical protein [Candidatus Nitrotoga sp.]MDP1856120.1 hypothetical protein [Candidatus Nitrotoga sp.]